MKKNVFGISLLLISISVFGQKSSKLSRYFADPIMADSSSTLMIPTRYNSDLLASAKLTLWGDYYANIIFYDFKTDTSKRLFTEDTFINAFPTGFNNSYYQTKSQNDEFITRQWIFYFVKPLDFDKNGRIDNGDPSILYVSDKYGNDLKAITPTDENALSINVYNNKDFVLIKMQRDLDHDNDFESSDVDYYYIRLDLKSLTLGNKIETKN